MPSRLFFGARAQLPDRRYVEEQSPGSAKFVYNYWQRSFLTEDPAEAEHVARTAKNLEVAWEDSPLFGRYMATKHYTQAFELCPATGRNQLFASIADDYHWFDAWAGLKDLPHHERPLKLNFGDDEVMTRAEKQLFVDVYDACGTRIPWRQGDVAVCCNVRTAHGRPPISLAPGETRQLGVVLGPLVRKRGCPEHAW